MAVFTKIRKQYFEDIEREKFSSLPAEVYLRGYVMEYAKYLSLDPVKVAEDYLNRYREWKTGKARKVNQLFPCCGILSTTRRENKSILNIF